MERFKNIHPQLSNHSESGPEPSLYEIIKEYYFKNGIERNECEKLAKLYIYEWEKEEDR